MRKLLFIVLLLPLIVLSQEQEKKKFGIKFGGFVKTDIFFDSRQTVDARAGQFLLYPKNEMLDDNGDDINAGLKFNMLSIQTRLKGTITGPDVLGAKLSGVIEGAFFGNIGTDINGFRLRHAFVKLDWEYAEPKGSLGTELLVGQYWHPMFVTSCFPGTVNFNTGTPFQPFARNPQIRISQKLGKFNLIATALTQVDFASTGPDGLSTKYMINSGIPELNFRAEFNSGVVLAGAGVNYKNIQPRLYVESANVYNPEGTTLKTDELAGGTSFFAYFKLKTKPLTVKLYGVYGQMMYSMTMLGGYAEKEVVKEVYTPSDTITGWPPIVPVTNTTNINYTPIGTASGWIDIHTNGKRWQFGLFSGYSKNLGSKDLIEYQNAVQGVGTQVYYSRGNNIAYVYRISPRVIYNVGKFRIAPEIDYTVAAYGSPDEKGVVQNAKEIGNFRFLLGVYFFF